LREPAPEAEFPAADQVALVQIQLSNSPASPSGFAGAARALHADAHHRPSSLPAQDLPAFLFLISRTVAK
jgi:hypothetical protein